MINEKKTLFKLRKFFVKISQVLQPKKKIDWATSLEYLI